MDEVCAAVEAHPPFEPLLDRSPRVGSMTESKWEGWGGGYIGLWVELLGANMKVLCFTCLHLLPRSHPITPELMATHSRTFTPLSFQPCARPRLGGWHLLCYRWQQHIGKELSRLAYFQRTGIKRNGQAVWRLDPSHFDAMPAKQRRKLKDLHLPGAPYLGKHGQQN